MTKRAIRKMPLLKLGALPPDPRDFARFMPPRINIFPPGRRTFGPAPADHGTGPAVGARVASLHCPILRCGQHQLRRPAEVCQECNCRR